MISWYLISVRDDVAEIWSGITEAVLMLSEYLVGNPNVSISTE